MEQHFHSPECTQAALLQSNPAFDTKSAVSLATANAKT